MITLLCVRMLTVTIWLYAHKYRVFGDNFKSIQFFYKKGEQMSLLMSLLNDIIAYTIIIYILSLPVTWVWILYHKIRCRKVNACTKKTCRYWEWCRHNLVQKQIDKITAIEMYLNSLKLNRK